MIRSVNIQLYDKKNQVSVLEILMFSSMAILYRLFQLSARNMIAHLFFVAYDELEMQ